MTEEENGNKSFRTSKQTKHPLRDDDIGDIKFSPVLSVQRYDAVREIIRETPEITKVADFGAGEGNFVKFLKNVQHITEISTVEIDYSCCNQCVYKTKPLPWDHFFGRPNPLIIKVYHGSILEHDHRLKGYDAITCIEVIEHLLPIHLESFAENIFGYVKPKLVLITTPNADFNVLFPEPKKFRHWDHKFEWTRDEFLKWCESVVDIYSYTFNITQIGYGPKGTEHVGGCSQMAVFKNVGDNREFDDKSENYELLNEVNYPKKSEETQCQNTATNNTFESSSSSESESEYDTVCQTTYFDGNHQEIEEYWDD